VNLWGTQLEGKAKTDTMKTLLIAGSLFLAGCAAISPRAQLVPVINRGEAAVDAAPPLSVPDSSVFDLVSCCTSFESLCYNLHHVLVLSRDRRYCRVVVYSSVDGLIITHPLRSTKNRKFPRSLFGLQRAFCFTASANEFGNGRNGNLDNESPR
jgi:hypothetical protein